MTKQDTKDFASDLIQALNKESGMRVAYNLSVDESPTHVKRWISTGSKLLDYICANRKNGGLPEGRIVEIFGPPSTVTAQVLILVRGPRRVEVQATAQSRCGRILGIILARNARRMAIFGFYGHTNAMRDERKLRETTKLLRILQHQIEKYIPKRYRRRKKHHA